MEATRKHLCRTCGAPRDWRKAYCSESCRPICVHPTCERPARGRTDVCDRHRVMRETHGELRPDTWANERLCVVCGEVPLKGSGRRKYCSAACQQLDHRWKGKRPTTLTCKLCGLMFSTTVKSGKRIQRSDTTWCPDCNRDSPEVARFRKYGVTPAAYAEALRAGCDICADKPEQLHIDHDHACCPPVRGHGSTCGKCVRGFLCGSCNRALGMMRDDPQRLRSAVDYLEKFAKQSGI